MSNLRISAAFRVALAAKALLLAAIAVLFVVLARAAWANAAWPLPARLLGAVLFAVGGSFPAAAAYLGLADALLGEALEASGARPLASRRSGYSLRLPGGRFVEYVLFNPWGPLDAGRTYRVTFGRYSSVLVAPPVAEPAPGEDPPAP
jgi:hypothetical protein